jgi:hypothetical protein
MGYFLIAAMVGGQPFWPVPPRIQPKVTPPGVVWVKPRIALKPGQACAIPLLNVLPRRWGHDDMVKRMAPPPPQEKSPEIVTPPAPSCDDVK